MGGGGVIWLQRSISAYEEKTAVSRRYLGLLVEVPDRAMISLRKIVCLMLSTIFC